MVGGGDGVARLTGSFSRAFLEALVRHDFINLLGHCLDVKHDQLIEIGVGVFTANLECSAHREFVLLVQFQYVNMLEDVF